MTFKTRYPHGVLLLGILAGVFVLLGGSGCFSPPSPATAENDGTASWWWPEQQAPSRLAVLPIEALRELNEAHGLPASEGGAGGPYRTLVQSVAGLAAQAVNEGRFDEMLWVDYGSESGAEWYRRLTERLEVETRQSPAVWDLVQEYHEAGVIDGYILYRWESTPRSARPHGVDGDQSVNVGTMLAGLHGGILVEENMENRARELGLEKLADARDRSPSEVFEQSKEDLADRWALLQSPCFSFVRDLAIAHRMPVVFGTGEYTDSVYAWMPPGGLVIGWNNAPEDVSVIQLSRFGHTLIPSDWSSNMTALSAGATMRDSQPKFTHPEPDAQASGERPRMGLFMSDGDNLQWILTSFTHSGSFWANPRRGSFPMGWGLPVADLIQTAPDVYDYLVETQTPMDGVFVHYGYYYPDLLGSELSESERRDVLRLLGARVESTLQRSGATHLTFLVHNLDSPGAREACRIIAESSPSLEAMFAIQYHPYEGGEGKVYRIETDDGREVPVSTARYAMWADTSGRPRAGGLDELPGIVRRDIQDGEPVDGSWIILHAWSRFESGEDGGMHMGMTPAFDLFESLRDRVDFVSLDQLLAGEDQ